MHFQPLLILSFLILPVFIVYFTSKSKLANRIGAIMIAYFVGLVIGNIGLIPHPGDYLSHYLVVTPGVNLSDIEYLFAKGIIPESDIVAYKIRILQDMFLTLTIPIALPLMLFSMNIRSWFKMAGTTFLSMLLALFSILLVVAVNIFLFKDHVEGLSKISGMLIGLYTGGTPNLAALKMMLNVDADTYIKVHTYDMIPSLLYLLFLVSIGKGFFRKILPKYPVQDSMISNNGIVAQDDAYNGFFRPKVFTPILMALLVAIIIFAIAASTTLFVNGENQMLVVILVITTLSILASLIPAVNKIEKSFELGMYFILVFSIAVASMADLRSLMNLSGSLFLLISTTIFTALFLHALLSKIFNIDADTLMVTSTALICSPPFVPMIAGALKNKEIVVSGLTVGIIGYAVGNYLGVLVSYLSSIFI